MRSIPGLSFLAFALLLSLPASSAGAQDDKDKDEKEIPVDDLPEKPDEQPIPKDEKKAHDRKVVTLVGELKRIKNKQMQTARIAEIGREGDRAARDAIIAFSRGNKSHEAVEACFEALAGIGDDTVLFYLCGKRGLKASSDFLIQLAAIDALGRIGDIRVTQPLLRLMNGRRTKIEVISKCCQVLSQMNASHEEVRKGVMALAGHKHDTVRANAVESLGRLHTDEAYDRLIATLKKDSNSRVRGAAAAGLALIGRATAIPLLREKVKDDKSMTVRAACLKAIEDLGG